MKITIRQFGGHRSNYAGDCALIEIEAGAHSQVIVIDTGASKIWSKPTELREHVHGALPQQAHAPRTLITTHFHKDHYDPNVAGRIKWDNWFHGDVHEVEGGTGQVVSGNERVLTGGEGKMKYYVDCYAPDWSEDEAAEENDMSLAVAVYASDGVDGFRFLSFGDMTKEGEARLRMGSLFPVEVAKYPHHGSEKNYLKYFGLGVCDTVVISGDSGSAANTAEKLFGDGVQRIRVVTRTTEAAEQISHAWSTKQRLYASLRGCDLSIGRDLVIEWQSGGSHTMSYLNE